MRRFDAFLIKMRSIWGEFVTWIAFVSIYLEYRYNRFPHFDAVVYANMESGRWDR